MLLLNTVSPFLCYLADIAVILIIGLFGVLGFYRGAFKSLFGFGGSILSFLLAVLLCKPIALLLGVMGVEGSLTTSIEKTLLEINEGFALSVNKEGLVELMEEMNFSLPLKNTILSLKILDNETGTLASVLAPTISSYIITGAVFFSLVLIFNILVKIFSRRLSNHLAEHEVVSLVDKILGTVLSVLSVIVYIYFVLFALSLITSTSVSTFIDGTVLLSFMYEYNLFSAIITLFIK